MKKPWLQMICGHGFSNINQKKEGDTVVELDQFKYTLSTYDKPLVEVRDSL